MISIDIMHVFPWPWSLIPKTPLRAPGARGRIPRERPKDEPRWSLALIKNRTSDSRIKRGRPSQIFTGFKLSSLSVNISNNYVFKIIIVVHFYCSIVMYFLQMSTDVYSTWQLKCQKVHLHFRVSKFSWDSPCPLALHSLRRILAELCGIPQEISVGLPSGNLT